MLSSGATPGEIFEQSIRPTAVFGRLMARVTSHLSESLGAEQINPAFHPTHAEARAALATLAADPQPLPRPLVIIGGYMDALQILGFVDSLLRPTVRNTPIIPVALGNCHSFAAAYRKTTAAIDAALLAVRQPVDVVGLSLGGAVAVDVCRNLSVLQTSLHHDVKRLFAIGSPFTGVQLAEFIPITPYFRAMRPNSPLMQKIAAASMTLDIIAYGHRRDDVVGIEHCAPPSRAANWLADNSWFWPHLASLFDVRIVADIALRLHGKPPLGDASGDS